LRAGREMATQLQRRLDHQEQTAGRQGVALGEGVHHVGY
jgi:hypothetical protein